MDGILGRSMPMESQVSFGEVCQVFSRENPDPSWGSTNYALGLLRAANDQFGSWQRRVLTQEDISRIMLPHHNHEYFELVPPSGLVVSDALGRLDLAPQSHVCPRRIEQVSREPLSSVFLSAAPLKGNSDYQELVLRSYGGLTHLDGLHRLIASALRPRGEIVAYVAGRF